MAQTQQPKPGAAPSQPSQPPPASLSESDARVKDMEARIQQLAQQLEEVTTDRDVWKQKAETIRVQAQQFGLHDDDFQLVQQKIRAGLPAKDAIDVVNRQKAADASLKANNKPAATATKGNP